MTIYPRRDLRNSYHLYLHRRPEAHRPPLGFYWRVWGTGTEAHTEGAESGSDAKYMNFLQISRGLCSEVRSMLYLEGVLGTGVETRNKSFRESNMMIVP